ncbi:hypothetical protein V5O48_012635 [Marasmius crinis-equi]|uniref:Uncharacterized protein n=1 Tax=Marasmius crinis-equi TaxID=585013 RepID=A0ABR3F282_9AGAR
MKFFATSLFIAAVASLVNAAPSPAPEIEARANCDYAYNGNSPTKRGPGVLYSCSRTSFVVTSYVCYVGSGPTYCCSGDLVSTSAGPMVGGCFAS